MSNILNNTTALKSIKEAWNSKLNGEAKFETHIDNVAKHMRWTDAVSPTKNNLASGKSTTSAEGYTQLKELFESILKAKKRDHDSMAIGSAIKDLKNALMLRQAPKVFNDTGGNLGKIESVENGEATVKETKSLTTIEMRNQLITNLKNWVEKNKDDLGNDYVPTRKAVLTVFETLSIKR
tara:strand:- start:297 stop:836 length:540 start_codon:yes stop_codon:yes gene_type:complete